MIVAGRAGGTVAGHRRGRGGAAGSGVVGGAGQRRSLRRGRRRGDGVWGPGEALGRQAAYACDHVVDVGVVPAPRRRLRGGRDQGDRVAGPVGCWNVAWTVPTASAIMQARKWLGRAVFSELFERICGPVAGGPGLIAQVVALGSVWIVDASVAAAGHRRVGDRRARQRGKCGRVRLRRVGDWRSAFPMRGWWRWPSAARMPSSLPRSTATGLG